VGQRFLAHRRPGLEAQLCNLADAIAYNAHDVDDGVRSGLLTLAQVQAVPLFDDFYQQTLREHPHLAQPAQGRRLLYETIRRMLSAQVYDVIDTTRQALEATRPTSVDEARALPPLLRFSEAMHARSTTLKQFLFQNLYRHPQVTQTTQHARTVVRELFDAYRQAPQEMQAGFAARVQAAPDEAAALRAVADYIAGMTDRFASREHERLTGRSLLA
jgi:dGTPase